MAVEIGASWFGEPVRLDGADARRFVAETLNPSHDERRIEHLRRSAGTYARVATSATANELLRRPG